MTPEDLGLVTSEWYPEAGAFGGQRAEVWFWLSAAHLARFVFQLDNCPLADSCPGPFLAVHGVLLQAEDRHSLRVSPCSRAREAVGPAGKGEDVCREYCHLWIRIWILRCVVPRRVSDEGAC